MNSRITIILAALVLLGGGALFRLAFLQISNHGFYKALAAGQQQVSSLAKGERGEIFARDKEGKLYPLAFNKRIASVFISPPEVEDEKKTAEVLSRVLGLSLSGIQEKISKKESLYELIAKNISKEQKEVIEREQLAGLYVGQDAVRFYPQEAFASRLLGFTNQDGKGQYGVEEYHNEQLEGKEGVDSNAQNPGGYLLSAAQHSAPDGQDIYLTIDYHIQAQAEELLQKQSETLAYEEGTIIIADPQTGKLLALATYPNFNPNNYSGTRDLSLFQNPAVQKLFEPGSIFKPLTMAAALDREKITPDTQYEDTGVVHIGGRFVENYGKRSYGKRTMKEVLQFSINTGAVFAQQQLGTEHFLAYIKKFGIFEPTHIDLPGEVYSENREFQKGYAINFATASFGQGIEMNTLQILRAFFAFANNGYRVDPYITQGEKKDLHKIAVISPQTASEITSMLVSVIEEGYGKKAKIPGYYIAGKTGTAQISWSALGVSKSGYSEQTLQSFIGYAPAYHPKFIILVVLRNPKTGTAEYSAMPIFKDLAKYIIDYYQISPDYKIEE